MSTPPPGIIVSPHPGHAVNRPRYIATVDTCERGREDVIADCWEMMNTGDEFRRGWSAGHGVGLLGWGRVPLTPREQRHGCVGRDYEHGLSGTELLVFGNSPGGRCHLIESLSELEYIGRCDFRGVLCTADEALP